MRGIVFRVLAGLLAAGFGALLAFGNTTKMSLREVFGIGVIGAGFGLYALLGSDRGERLIWVVFGGGDHSSNRPPANKHSAPDNAADGGA